MLLPLLFGAVEPSSCCWRIVVVACQKRNANGWNAFTLDLTAGEELLKQLDSSVKRNNALIKKLKQLTEDTSASVMDEVQKVNQAKVLG